MVEGHVPGGGETQFLPWVNQGSILRIFPRPGVYQGGAQEVFLFRRKGYRQWKKGLCSKSCSLEVMGEMEGQVIPPWPKAEHLAVERHAPPPPPLEGRGMPEAYAFVLTHTPGPSVPFREHLEMYPRRPTAIAQDLWLEETPDWSAMKILWWERPVGLYHIERDKGFLYKEHIKLRPKLEDVMEVANETV